MGATIEPRLLRWRDTHELFNADAPLLVFLTDAIDDEWSEIPGDVLAILETMQSTAATRVRVYTADFRVDADFLSLFSTRPGASVVRRVPGQDTFELLAPGFTFGDLIEFCRPAFDWVPPVRFSPPAPVAPLAAASGEIRSRSQTAKSGEIVL